MALYESDDICYFNTWLLEPTRVSTTNSISIGSAVFAGLTEVTLLTFILPCLVNIVKFRVRTISIVALNVRQSVWTF